MLPSPASTRFQPLRSGLINLFKYENQQFWYEHGRLLVRGNNGSGKSRVLALQLPFLLDGEISPSRVEPDGDRARQIAWHLTMGEYAQRTGYTWIEFGRRDETGAEQFVTLGCGMKAIKDADHQPTRWFFVTPLRVDRDFDLVADSRPLTAEQLATRIGEDAFHKTAQDYRRAVDARLFSLGEERYGALLDLLIRLRAPQLAKKLEEKTLYAALSESLPPLASDLVEKVAAAFRDLDDLRHEFDSLTELARVVEEFCGDYRRYAQVVVARRAARLATAHSQFEKHQRGLADLNRKVTTARLAEEDATLAARRALDDARVASTHYDTLQQSPAAHDAQSLGIAESAAQAAAQRLRETVAASETADAALTAAEDELSARETHAEEADAALAAALAATLPHARASAFASAHARLLPAEPAHWPAQAAALTALRRSHTEACQTHSRHLDTLDLLLKSVADAREKLAATQRAETLASGEVSRLREIEQSHDREARAAAIALAEHYTRWHSGLRWLRAPAWFDLQADLELWLDTAANENRRLPAVLEATSSAEVAALATARAQLNTRRDELNAHQTLLREEHDRLSLGPPPPPGPPATRDAASRENRAGAALWQACEFAAHLSPVERAGLEAALEASGLLDAWITPDGRLLADFPADTFLATEETTAGSFSPTAPTLGNWLVPDGSALPADTVRRALSRVAAGPAASAAHWVALDGCWRLGPLTGRGQKDTAQHLGASSRESARLARLAAIEAELADLARHAAGLDAESAVLDERAQAARAERAAAPNDQTIATALSHRSSRRVELSAARLAFEQELAATQAAREALATATATRDRDATGLGFGEHLPRLETLRGAWRDYEFALASLWPAAGDRVTRLGLADEARARRVRVAEQATLASGQAESARAAHLEAHTAYETLRARVGASIEEFQTQLQSAKKNRDDTAAAQTAADKAVSAAAERRAGLEAQLEPETALLKAADSARDEAAQQLRLPLHHGLFFEADPALGDIERDAWSPTRAIEIARRVERTLPNANLDEARWTQVQNNLQTRLNDLRTRAGPLGCQARSEVVGPELSTVVCVYQGIEHTPASLRGAVLAELAERERLLSERERGIIEKHLVSEVSARLHSLIADAKDRKDKMNAEMTRCATTLGVTLRLVWEPIQDDTVPAGLRPVLRLIQADHGAWTDAERNQVGAFLHQLIRDERQRDPAATWPEQLARALDYRRWHAFGAERRQDGKWERLTRQRYGTGSGGEKALMLTIPQMAAAASHYRSAAPHAPRLILLDEAFAGMDKPTRARCMGLLDKGAFDLDLLMTSEREWGAHDTVSGIAIYQLVADADAIAATRWVWNGRKKLLAPVPDTPELRAERPQAKPAAASSSAETNPHDELPLG